MDNKEAIKNIKEHCYFANLNPQAKKSLDKAIASLEAWDKIKEELEKEMNEYENVYTDLDYSTGVGYALATIEEHLKEIEE